MDWLVHLCSILECSVVECSIVGLAVVECGGVHSVVKREKA